MPTFPLERLGRPYAYLDPASGRKQARRPGARSAMIVACHAPPAFLVVLHAWAARASTTELTEQIFTVNAQYAPVQIAIETAGQQYLLYSHIMDESLRRGVKLPLVEGLQYTEDAKDQRIRECIEPLTTQGRLCVMSHHIHLKQELADYPRGATKDLLDALAGAANLIPKPHTTSHTQDARQAILDYLHRAHVPEPERYIHTLGYPSRTI